MAVLQTALVLLAVLVLGFSAEDVDYRKLYKETLRKYHRTPALSISLVDGRNAQYQAFKKHAQDVYSHNDEPDKEWFAEINEFALETDDELKRRLGLNMSDFVRSEVKINKQNQQTLPNLMAQGDLPGYVDYTDNMTNVKRQDGCRSCWAFSAVAALEYQVNKDRQGVKKALSEQQYVNCVYPRNGCLGGWPADCFLWSAKHGGHIASRASYPYTGGYGTCLYTSKKNTLSGWTISPKARFIEGDSNLQTAVANPNIGVLIVAIAVMDTFYSYKQGVYSSKKCGYNEQLINHAVNVVGYGVDKKTGVAYWRVRNSWGEDWGDNGYINMKRGVNGENVNMCQISDWAHYPAVTGSDEEGTEESKVDTQWCEIKNEELQGYATGERVAMEDLNQAISACSAMADCTGLTKELYQYTLRSGYNLVDSVGSSTFLPGECSTVCTLEKAESGEKAGKKQNLERTGEL